MRPSMNHLIGQHPQGLKNEDVVRLCEDLSALQVFQ
jgi:hypothetical protein